MNKSGRRRKAELGALDDPLPLFRELGAVLVLATVGLFQNLKQDETGENGPWDNNKRSKDDTRFSTTKAGRILWPPDVKFGERNLGAIGAKILEIQKHLNSNFCRNKGESEFLYSYVYEMLTILWKNGYVIRVSYSKGFILSKAGFDFLNETAIEKIENIFTPLVKYLTVDSFTFKFHKAMPLKDWFETIAYVELKENRLNTAPGYRILLQEGKDEETGLPVLAGFTETQLQKIIAARIKDKPARR